MRRLRCGVARSSVVVGVVFWLAFAAHAQAPEAGGCVGKARLRGPLWDTAANTLEPGLEVALDEIARVIREDCGGKSIVIEAHAFELPTAELNRLLSELRVTLVRHELEKRGVPSRQLLPVPLGDTHPMGSKSDPGYVLENRRITFRVVP
jgi:outer membrane protein OmpA-like peptidoglycan-associated protein